MPDRGTMIEPVVKSVTVALAREKAFRLFTGGCTPETDRLPAASRARREASGHPRGAEKAGA